jgi:hypothetical protein
MTKLVGDIKVLGVGAPATGYRAAAAARAGRLGYFDCAERRREWRRELRRLNIDFWDL